MQDEISNNDGFRIAYIPVLLKKSYLKLANSDPLRMAGATAFFTSFALPFILIILLQVLGLVFDPHKLRRELFEDLAGTFGAQSVDQVITTLVAFRHLASNWIVTILGFLFLLLVSTTLLMVIKASINQIWRIKEQSHKKFLMKLGIRLQSVLIIVGTGILFLISILAEAVKAYLGKSLTAWWPNGAYYFMGLLTYIFSILLVTFWFGIIFRLLPDARPTWKIALTGAFVTAILFNLGKYVLRLLLTTGNLHSLYGASASIVLILLFVFYTSLIMYFGAAFTHVWAEYKHEPIKPMPYASRYKLTEVAEV
jgi:membrane protein